MNMTCDRIQDLLPDLAAGTVAEGTATLLRAHLRDCNECAAEWALIEALRDEAVAAPPELAARISATLATRTVAAVPAKRPGQWGPRHLAVAATVAVAMIGGAIASDQFRNTVKPAVTVSSIDSASAAVVRPDTQNRTAPNATSSSPAAAGYAPIVEPVLGTGSGSVVAELTEAQLVALLAEMGE